MQCKLIHDSKSRPLLRPPRNPHRHPRHRYLRPLDPNTPQSLRPAAARRKCVPSVQTSTSILHLDTNGYRRPPPPPNKLRPKIHVHGLPPPIPRTRSRSRHKHQPNANGYDANFLAWIDGYEGDASAATFCIVGSTGRAFSGSPAGDGRRPAHHKPRDHPRRRGDRNHTTRYRAARRSSRIRVV